MNVKKRRFTLIEIFISLGIIALVISLIGVNVIKMIDHEKFKADLAKIVQHLNQSQEMMLIKRSSVDLLILQEGEKWRLEKRVLGLKFLKSHLREQIESVVKLPTVRSVIFYNDETDREESTPIRIEFLLGGKFISRGVLEVVGRNGEKKQIFLSGKLEAIDLLRRKEGDWEENLDELYPEELLADES